MDDVTCGNECCHWVPPSPEPWTTWTAGPGYWLVKLVVVAWPGRLELVGQTVSLRGGYCPHTGEALRVVDGQPVVEPRQSPEYVRLAEDCIRRRQAPLPDFAPRACLYRQSLLAPQRACCTHEDPPIGCLRALAAERGKEE